MICLQFVKERCNFKEKILKIPQDEAKLDAWAKEKAELEKEKGPLSDQKEEAEAAQGELEGELADCRSRVYMNIEGKSHDLEAKK
jgi:hypothetical protein